jgi:predicted nucleotidyltransferase
MRLDHFVVHIDQDPTKLQSLKEDERMATHDMGMPSTMKLCPEAAEILQVLFQGIEETIGDNLTGIYLRGSLALGDFDPETSDIDFLVVTHLPISDEKFAELRTLHSEIARLPNRYANDLEGAYIHRAALRRFRAGERHPTFGRGEVLRWVEHRANWVIERWIVREHGVTIIGPDPKTLINPVSAEELRDAVRDRLRDWEDWARKPDDPDWRLPLSHKAYVIETMCRGLYTVSSGALCSKPQAVEWAVETLPEPWRSLVERSRKWRTDSSLPDPATVDQVQRFVLWTASRCNWMHACSGIPILPS